jgi:hypothetical protein
VPDGEWNKRIPRDLRGNLLARRRVMRECRTNAAMRKLVRKICAEDCLFFINLFVWQYNPRKKGGEEIGPFCTWDFQEEAVREVLWCIEHDEDMVIEKSREMGATWLLLLVMLWLHLFRPWQKFLCISRNEAAVEAEDPDSLFWKLDFVLDYLPGWLKPKINRRKLFFGNEDNGSTITGQASTGRAGVGGRATAMFIDEFSQITEDYEVLHRTSDTTGCRIFNGTHLGLGTAFYELTKRVDMKKLRMHWSQHPDKRHGLYQYSAETKKVEVFDPTFEYADDFRFVMDGKLRSPWYDQQCKRKGSARAIAMDLDIDPQGSVSQVFSPVLIHTLKANYGSPPWWEGDLRYDRDMGRPLELVERPGGLVKLWCKLDNSGRPAPARYSAGADIAAGTGATPSCFTVVNAQTGEKVLEYADPHIDAKVFAALCCAFCWLFKDREGEGAIFAWEMQGPGIGFGKRFLELGYRRIYFRKNEQKLSPKGDPDTPGWYPSPDNKRVLIEDYHDALRKGEFLNRSIPALEECLAFRYSATGKIEHGQEASTNDPTGARENHGDRVVADALAWKMAKGLYQGEKKKEADEPPLLSMLWRRKYRDQRAGGDGFAEFEHRPNGVMM